MEYSKKTKIVCTIGPSSWDQEIIKQMIEAGMNCARVNGAFADEAELDKVTTIVRNVSAEVALMMDVKGPEVRMNKFSQAKEVHPGKEVIIGNDESAEIYPANYKDLYKNIKQGQRIVIGDGDTELKVKEVQGDKMVCEVIFGELLKPGKALNLPGADFITSALTEKDLVNLKHSIELGWDFVSASFIQSAESAREVKKHLEGSTMKLIAKIEDADGVDNIDEILEIVDGIMVARGGLGVEMGLENVPLAQLTLIEKAVNAGKPVITATQMLESMITNPQPTRAEVNDVATAIMLGSDAVMLSGESSAGEYPVESVKFLTRIAKTIEPNIEPGIIEEPTGGAIGTDAITKAVAQIAIELGEEIKAVISVSRTGRTARLIGRHGIKQPLFAFVSTDHYMRALAICKGINRSFVLPKVESDRDEAVKFVLEEAKRIGIVSSGDKVIFVSKSPYGTEDYFPNVLEAISVE